MKRLENAACHLRIYTRAGIFDLDHKVVLIGGLSRYLQYSRATRNRRHRFDSIQYQI